MCRTRFCRHRRSSKLNACLPGSGDAIVLVLGRNCVSAHNGAPCTVSDPQSCCHRIHSPLSAPRCPCPAPDTLPLSVPVIEASCRYARAKNHRIHSAAPTSTTMSTCSLCRPTAQDAPPLPRLRPRQRRPCPPAPAVLPLRMRLRRILPASTPMSARSCRPAAQGAPPPLCLR